MTITFLGAAGTVTGSKTLLQIAGRMILVDCGQFQGLKELRLKNREPFAFDPSKLDFVLLTHGHLDHCGMLPRLVADGFSGPIFCSGPTRDVVRIILTDSAKIHEEEAAMANQGGYSKHSPATPLYTRDDAMRVFPLLKTVHEGEVFSPADNLQITFSNAGHILGACSIKIDAEGKTIVFSGDIGQSNDLLMHPPTKPLHADCLIMESTYGDKIHPTEDPMYLLEAYVGNALRSHGTVIIPGFAVGRLQTMMYLLWKLRQQDRIPDVPFVLDTPMGAEILEVMRSHQRWHKLSVTEFEQMCAMFTVNRKYEQTIQTLYDVSPKVILAASGMLTGGRVLSYLEKYVGDPLTCIILVGFQAEGTRGRQLLEGFSQLKIRGKFYQVKAKVLPLDGLSAHADQPELLEWASQVAPGHVFLVHGEGNASHDLAAAYAGRYGIMPMVAEEGMAVKI
jgi:metallo-beta-lactamase family protein